MSKSKTLTAIMLIFSMLLIFTACAEIEDTSTNEDATTETTEKTETANENDPGISKAEFDQLKTGMSYEEAVEIIGGEGEVLSESGTPGGTDLDIYTIMYSWQGESGLGANANIMFQGDKLNTKAQFGLK